MKKIIEYFKINFTPILFVITLISFGLIAEDVFEQEIMKADVIAGFLVSISYLIIYISVIKKHIEKTKEFLNSLVIFIT